MLSLTPVACHYCSSFILYTGWPDGLEVPDRLTAIFDLLGESFKNAFPPLRLGYLSAAHYRGYFVIVRCINIRLALTYHE